MPTFNDGENLGSVRTKINAVITTVDAIDQGLSTTDSPVFASIETTDADSINNITVGLGSGSVATNTALGPLALSANTTGANNTGLGYRALFNTTTAMQNTAVGADVLFSNTTGNNNSASGYQALLSNTTGSKNTANGYRALFSNTTGANNTAVGDSALFDNTTGNNNTAIGQDAETVSATGSNQIAIRAGTTKWLSGAGTPEGVITAGIGSIYTRLDGGAGTTLYVKESGTGNTGWVAK